MRSADIKSELKCSNITLGEGYTVI